MRNTILEILKSNNFLERLQNIINNYSNLKQEGAIRNAVLEIFNQNNNSVNPTKKAFAEHPRFNSCRVDLSIVDKTKLNDPYLIEFKYQYTDDYKQMSNYVGVIQNDFQRLILDKQTDMFILIITFWKKELKNDFDNSWNIKSNLSKYICEDAENKWHDNISSSFSKFENTKLDRLDLELYSPYPSSYRFYILSRS